MTEQTVAAVVPAYNEAGTIGDVAADLVGVVDILLVVDDGSTDRTACLARRAGAVVVSHDDNQGYDQALSYGVAYAAEHGADIVVTFDADGQHVSSDIERVTAHIRNGSAAIVVGKRPYPARLAERLFALYAAWRIDIEDPLSGFKAYDVNVYRDVGYFDRCSSIGTHLLVAAAKRGYNIAQVEIKITERADEPRFGHLWANWSMLKALWRIIIFDVRTAAGPARQRE